MTFRAVLDDGKEHKPVLLLLTGQMTAKQIDKEYRGSIGKCPDCEGYLRQSDLADGGTFAAAVAGKDRRVRYRRGRYDTGTDDLLTQMHFAHAAGYLLDGLAPCSCKTKNQLIHIEAVEAIAHQYRKDMPDGFQVEAECQFVKPGTPPETYRPDIVVFNQFGGKHTCIEYQRSPEKFESFVHRHELRGSEWGSVIWFFDRRIWNYRSTCEARDWLFDNGQTFYQCWVDELSLQLQVEEGTFATALVKEADRKRLPKPFVPKHCSIADIVNAYMKATGQEPDGKGDRVREQPEPPKADRLQGFNLVQKSEKDRQKQRQLFETLKRQQERRVEEERRMREWQAKKKLLEDIEWTYDEVRILGLPRLEADINWPNEDLRALLNQLEGMVPDARARHEEVNAAYQARLQQEAADRLAAARAKAEEEARVRAEQSRIEEQERQRQAEEYLRRQALYQEEWRRKQAEIEEKRQREEDAERRMGWTDVEVVRHRGTEMVINLMVGDQIRQMKGRPVETYKGRTAAGYSTDRYTYPSLRGWEVSKPASLASKLNNPR
jgi:hypothetical protein